MPNIFAIDYEEIQQEYKFITGTSLVYNGQDKMLSCSLFPNDAQRFSYGFASNPKPNSSCYQSSDFDLKSKSKPDHFPFGAKLYKTIIDEELETVYITTDEYDCEIVHLSDYDKYESKINPLKMIKVTGSYNGPKLTRNLASKSAIKVSYSSEGEPLETIEEWSLSNKVLSGQYEFELPVEYIFTNRNKEKEIKLKTNIFNQRNIKESKLFAPLHCYNHQELEFVVFNLTSLDDLDMIDNAWLVPIVKNEIKYQSGIKSINRISELVFDTVSNTILLTR